MYVMGGRLAFIALLCACNARLGTLANNDTNQDAGSGSSSNQDGGTDPDGTVPPDAPLGPWGTPAMIANAGPTGASVDDPTVSSDTLDLLFAVQLSGASTKALYEMTRTSTTSPWSTPVKRTELDIGTSEESPRLSEDNMTVYYGVDGNIYSATRTAYGDAFMAPAKVTAVDTGTYEKWLAVCDNDVAMVSRSDPTTANMDLFEGTLADGAQTVATELNSTSNEISTFLSKDCLTVYFASNRSNDETQIYTATRTAVGQPWTAPVNAMTPFSANDGTDNEDPWESVDQRTFVFAGIRGTSTTKQLYISTR
jgi:hypothetical protein